MSSFRISHLSDLHLTAKDNVTRSEPKLFGALTGMNAHFRKIVASKVIQESDLVLVTGDVTDRGDFGAWQFFCNEMGTEPDIIYPSGLPHQKEPVKI